METEYKGFVIKEITEQTLSEMLQLNDVIVNNLENKDFFISPDEETCLKFIKDKNILFIGIYNKETNEIMAYATLKLKLSDSLLKIVTNHFINSKESDFAYYLNIAVHPKFRGQKIQQKVEEYFSSYATKLGFKYLTTNVHPDNVHSKNNFFKGGYSIITTIYYSNNTPRLVLAKQLN